MFKQCTSWESVHNTQEGHSDVKFLVCLLLKKRSKWTALVPPRSSQDPHIHFIKMLPTPSKLPDNKKMFLLKVEQLYKTQMGRNG